MRSNLNTLPTKAKRTIVKVVACAATLAACSSETPPPVPPSPAATSQPSKTPKTPELEMADPPLPLYPKVGFLHRRNGALFLDGCFKVGDEPVPTRVNTIQNILAAFHHETGRSGVLAAVFSSESEREESEPVFINDPSLAEDRLLHPTGGTFYHNSRQQEIMCEAELPPNINFPDYAIGALVVVRRDAENAITAVRGPYNETSQLLDPAHPQLDDVITVASDGTLIRDSAQPPLK